MIKHDKSKIVQCSKERLKINKLSFQLRKLEKTETQMKGDYKEQNQQNRGKKGLSWEDQSHKLVL